MSAEWDNDSDFAHDETGVCQKCGNEFDMWNRWGIEHIHCQLCRRKEREQRAAPSPLCKCGKPVYTLGQCKECNAAHVADLIHDGDYQ